MAQHSPPKPDAKPVASSPACSQRCIWIGLLLFYLATVLLCVAYGVAALMVLDSLLKWARSVSFSSVYSLSDDLVGVTGSCVVLIICIVVYLLFSLIVLCGKLCARKDHPDFRYGMLTGGTFFMIFICLQAAMSIHSSHYLLEGPLQQTLRERGVHDSMHLDRTLFNIATVLGYITSGLFLTMFTFLMMYQCSMACHCCSPPAEKESRPEAAPAASPTTTTTSPKSQKASQRDEETGDTGGTSSEQGDKPSKGKVPSPWA